MKALRKSLLDDKTTRCAVHGQGHNGGGGVRRFFIGNEKIRLLSGDALENIAVVFRHPDTASLKEDQLLKVKGVITEINTDFGCMIIMDKRQQARN